MVDLYQKKQTSFVEVNRLTKENVLAVALWCGGQHVEEIDAEDPLLRFAALNIPTRHGVRRASEGDYIVKEEGGNFNIWKAPEFEAVYEKIV